jgi:LmbE family N-acetylglucosaminyl deacetylase
VRFLGYPDGGIEPTYALRRDISRVIRQVRPERVLTWTPEWSWRPFDRNHPDHQAASEAALSAVFPDARNPFAHPELLDQEGLAPWEVGEVWLMGTPTPNHYVDPTEIGWWRICASASPPTPQPPACDQSAWPRRFRP